MISAFLYALPLAVLFMTLSNQWRIDGFIVGYIVGIIIMALIGDRSAQTNLRSLPRQLYWLAAYVARLGWSILLSGFDVTRRVLDPRLPVEPGEVVISTHDRDGNMMISALSAHAITVTPGEMVQDFTNVDGQMHMIVHTLDVKATSERIDQEQIDRMNLLKRIRGEEAQ